MIKNKKAFCKRDSRHRLWLQQVNDRDGGMCLSCEAKLYVVVRHILSTKEFPGLAYEVDNGISLCYKCMEWIKSGDDWEQVCRCLVMDRKFKNKEQKNEK